jgi:hypothetical protein
VQKGAVGAAVAHLPLLVPHVALQAVHLLEHRLQLVPPGRSIARLEKWHATGGDAVQREEAVARERGPHRSIVWLSLPL